MPGPSYSCIFQTADKCCAAITGERRLHCCKKDDAETIELSRLYFKIINGIDETAYYGCSLINQRSETDIYCMDGSFRETDYFSVRLEGVGRLSDIWIDCCKRFLFLVHSGSIEKFNLNGDYLERFMKAPSNTRYLAMCTWMEAVYLVYEREGCIYLAEYQSDRSYNCQLSLGSGYHVKGVEPEQTDAGLMLVVFAVKKGGICVFLNVALSAEEKKEPLQLELIMGKGVGEVTCSLKQSDACH